MGSSFDLSGRSFRTALYALQLLALLGVVTIAGLRVNDPVTALTALFLLTLVIVTAYGLWRARSGDDGYTHLGTPEDITYDPIADPGQAAKDRWRKSVRRLHEGDDDRE